MEKSGNHSAVRVLILVTLLAATCALAGDWSIFKGQVDGPVKNPGGVDPEAFTLKRYPGLLWSEGYYHHINVPDGSMVTVSIGFNKVEIDIAFVYDTPSMEPYHDYVITGIDEVKFDEEGFGYTIGRNRVRLDGNTYTMELELPRTRVRIVYDIIGPSYNYGDSMVRYPDGDTFEFYILPISWARVTVEANLDGKEVKFEGFGNMNHDAGEIFPTSIPANWQVFWFFGDDHTIAMTDHFSRQKFGKKLIQRLVFLDKAGNMFTSTSFDLKWSDWVHARDVPFRYPENYTLRAEAGGARLTMEVKMQEVLLMEDLLGNLPTYMRLVAERLTRNAWTLDSWSEYTLTYVNDGETKTYHGRGIVRWSDLEEEK